MAVYRRYTMAFGAAFLAALGVVSGLNIVVDPYFALRADTDDVLAPYRAKSLGREAKSEVARNSDFDVLLLGDSRVKYALNPDHAELRPYGRAWNLAVAGGTMYEAIRLLELATSNTSPRLVIWGFDPEFMGWIPRKLAHKGYQSSWLNPTLEQIPYYRQRLLGATDFIESVTDVHRAVFTPLSVQSHKGMSLEPIRPASVSRVTTDLTHLAHHLEVEELPEESGIPQLKPQLERLISGGTQVILLFPPMHATCHEVYFRRQDRRARAEAGIRELLSCTETLNSCYPKSPPINVWDFQGVSELHAESVPSDSQPRDMQWYRDPLHITPAVGDLVLKRLLATDGVPADFGVRLSSDMLDEHFEDLQRRRDEYTRRHPEQIRLVNAALKSVQ